MSMEEEIFMTRISMWDNFINHIIELNEKGYGDDEDAFYEKKCNECNSKRTARSSIGLVEAEFEYVVVSTTSDMELCVVAFRTKKGTNESLNENEGGWEVESVWHNDKKMKIKPAEIIAEDTN